MTVTLPPLALSVTGKLLLVLTVTLPKLKLLGLMLSWPGAVAVPDRVMDGEEAASEVMAMLPLAAPAVNGVNVTLKVKLCPAGRAKGVVTALMLKPFPVKTALDTFTLVPPVFFNVALRVLLLPTCTLPKFTEFAVRAPALAPVPERGIVSVDDGLLVVRARFTLLPPADCGAKATLNDVLAPAAKVMGKLRLLTV